MTICSGDSLGPKPRKSLEKVWKKSRESGKSLDKVPTRSLRLFESFPRLSERGLGDFFQTLTLQMKGPRGALFLMLLSQLISCDCVLCPPKLWKPSSFGGDLFVRFLSPQWRHIEIAFETMTFSHQKKSHPHPKPPGVCKSIAHLMHFLWKFGYCLCMSHENIPAIGQTLFLFYFFFVGGGGVYTREMGTICLFWLLSPVL